VIRVEGLVFEYPGTRALDGVEVHIAAGTITALVGPNGAGKTTLLRCIAALETPFAGRVTVDGLDVTEHPRAVHARLGYLSDFFGLYEDLTVRQCLTYHAAAHGIPAAQRAAACAVAAERLDIADLTARKAGALSRGQRQRVAIAQTIVHEPKVVLLDEPAAGLDPEARHLLSDLLRRLRDNGMTLLVSSHILSELEDYSTHVLMMEGGHVLDHRPVAAPAAAAARLQIDLVSAHDGLATALDGFPGLSDIVIDGATAVVAFTGDAEGRQALLRHLIDCGLPVIGLREARDSMEAIYLARLRDGAAPAERLP